MGNWLVGYFFYIPNNGSIAFQHHMGMAAVTATKRRAEILCPGVSIIMIMTLPGKLYFCLLHLQVGSYNIAAGSKRSP